MTGRHAGSSADDIARRHREKIARLERSAANWEAGAAGERAVGEILDHLTTAGWTVLHDVPWPGRAKANIDHVVVGPGGVFVVDAKNWSGRIDVREGQLFQNGRSRRRELQSVAGAMVAVTQLHSRVPTRPVLCLVSDEPRCDIVQDVVVCSTASLLDVIRSSPSVLTVEQVADVVQVLRRKLTRSQPASEAIPHRRTTRRARSSRRPLAVLAVGAVLLVSLATGTFSTLTDAVSEFVTEVVVDADPPVKQKDARDRPDKQRLDRER